ncbi:uncharacterized protein LOC101240790 isoform X2 [Hydra vulgaris]|uniref:Uncharacterized protein LOC101240790 isoform X2 n=1 Tax=Hydra vulgaris TaxID=6087 RepID=A0ABM4D3K0_HYDVU
MEINNNGDLARINMSPEQQTYILSLLQKQNNSQQLLLSQPTIETSLIYSKELTEKNVNTALKKKINSNDIDEIDNEEFIECVKKYSCLWNTALSSHKDYDKRKNAWEMINESLGGASQLNP